MKRNNLSAVLGVLLAVCVLCGCSTTSAIPDGEQLYTGMRPTTYQNYQKGNHFDQTREEMDVVLATTPNASLFGSSTMKSPFPIGLWIWNAFSQSQSGLGRWISRTFGSKPVLLSYANPDLHVSVGEGTLKKRGYFHGKIGYEILQQGNPKKAKMHYTVDMGPLWTIDSLSYVNFPADANNMIAADSANAILHNGDPFNVEKLEKERLRLSNVFRDNGYYYYDKNNAAYVADTISEPGKVLLHLQLADSLDSRVTRKWYIGHVTVNMKKQMFDSLQQHQRFRRYTFNYNGKRPPLRMGAMLGAIELRAGHPFSAHKLEQSQNKLNSTGLFSSTNFTFTPRDSTEDCDTLDMEVSCVFDKPYDFYVEAYGKGKTSGKFGPEFIVGFTKRNAFRSGELLNIKLRGAYEWQTGHASEGSKSKFNSYEYGAEASLDIPRIVNPFRTPIRKRLIRLQQQMEQARREGRTFSPPKPKHRFYATPSTVLKASTNVINRADYFKRHVVSGELTYNWQPTATSTFSLSPFSLTYEYMQSRTERFEALADSMPYLRTSMADQFIPKSSFSYTYISPSTYRNPITWWTTVSEASNLISLGKLCFGTKWSEKGKTMFKNPYAQFFKVETNFTKLWTVGEKSTVAAHINAGVVWSYGNSSVAPYTEQFYVGGANSIRAFNARSIGPGRYRSKTRMMSYVEQTGDIKFLANLEYRPHLMGSLYGAVFLDAGNVWLLHNDGSDGTPREGGKFQAKNLFKEMALGTGIGLRYDIGFFMLRLDWGIGLHVPYAGHSGFYNVDSFKDAQTLNLAIGLPF